MCVTKLMHRVEHLLLCDLSRLMRLLQQRKERLARFKMKRDVVEAIFATESHQSSELHKVAPSEYLENADGDAGDAPPFLRA